MIVDSFVRWSVLFKRSISDCN